MAIGTRRRIMTNERRTTTANSKFAIGGLSCPKDVFGFNKLCIFE